MEQFIDFLNELEKRKIYFRLNKVRDSLLVEVVIPGQRWEIEFFADSHVEVEKFISTGKIYDEYEIKKLINDFSD